MISLALPKQTRTVSLCTVFATCLLLDGSLGMARAQSALSIDPVYHHLGDDEIKDWPGVSAKPESLGLTREFNLQEAAEGTLRLKQRDVDGVWTLKINGIRIAELQRAAAERTSHYSVPAGVVHPGRNTLEIFPVDRLNNKVDDIAVGNLEWVPVPIRTLLDLRPFLFTVSQAGSKTPLPARVSVTDESGHAVDIHLGEAVDRAVRPGMIYTRGTATQVELPRGRYRIAATHGVEWSRDEKLLDLTSSNRIVELVALKLRREVDTRGFIAADTHIHTFTFSGHGNATMEERMISLAGEGVELAVATDHHHHIDYLPTQQRLNLNSFFTSVVGNEVSTANGHFNGFPMDPNGSVPDKNETDWVKLVESIRVRGGKVVILNHPRWPDVPRNPFTRAGLNRASGDRAKAGEFTFDAMELINSTALQDDPMYLFTDWFSLLNRGERIKAVGASDTHSVDDPVGQGRTYVASSTDVASQISVDEFCSNVLAGRASVSLGIFTDVRVEGRYGMGDVMPSRKGQLAARLRVAAPSWITPERAIAFVNGVRVAEMPVPHKEGVPTDVKLNFQIASRDYDSHLVFVVLGKGVQAPGWKTYKNYTLAATNPVYLDADGDGQIRSVREEAIRRLSGQGRDVARVTELIGKADAALGVQIAAVATPQLDAESLGALRRTLDRLATTDELYALYVRHLPQPQKK